MRRFRVIGKHASALRERNKDHIFGFLFRRNQLSPSRRISSARQGYLLAYHLAAPSAHTDLARRVGIVTAYHIRLVQRLGGLADIPYS